MKKQYKKKRGMAISQIILLLVSIIAFSYAVGSSIGFVSAQNFDCILSETNRQLVPVSGITPNTWCPDNGGSNVCTGGSGNWQLRDDKILRCPEGTPIDTVRVGITEQGPSTTQTQPDQTPSTPIPVNNGVDTVITGTKGEAGRRALGAVTDRPEVVKTKDAAQTGAKLSAGGIIFDLGVATAIYFGGKAILKEFGVEPALANAIAAGASAAYATNQIVLPILAKLQILSVGGPLGFGISVLAGLLVFALTFKSVRYEQVTFTCQPWIAPTGGEECEACNNKEFECTDYQCRSLGRGCELINKGTTNELCVWNNSRDRDYPIIQPWNDVLTLDYRYAPDNAISPPDRGVRIVREDTGGCVEANTRLRFGITLDEPAICKISKKRGVEFKDMENRFFGGQIQSNYSHSHMLSLSSLEFLDPQNLTIRNGGELAIYTRCEDSNGNSNVADFVFRFCVDESADTQQPSIISTSIINNSPIAFNQTSVDLTVSVDEPAECKWDRLDKSYDDMETQMSCSNNALEVNAQLLYDCSTTLTGLNDRVDNNFYFRCRDQPNLAGTDQEGLRNTMRTSHLFTLRGTRPLVIDSFKPNRTIRDSTDIIEVTLEAETSAGANEGNAVCYFSDTGPDTGFVQFFETNSHLHSQDLFLAEGDYTFYLRCVDSGGNADNATTSFTVESDSNPPVVVRAFHEETFLKLITNEKAECVYDSVDCSYLFEDGIKMRVVDDIEHFTTWDPDSSFYIKCQDEFGNRPFPNQCNIIVRPFEI